MKEEVSNADKVTPKTPDGLLRFDVPVGRPAYLHVKDQVVHFRVEDFLNMESLLLLSYGDLGVKLLRVGVGPEVRAPGNVLTFVSGDDLVKLRPEKADFVKKVCEHHELRSGHEGG